MSIATRASFLVACTASCALLALAVTPRPQAQSGLDQLAAYTITLAQRLRTDAALARFDAELALLDLRIAMAMDPPMGCPSTRDREAALERLRAVKREHALLQAKLRIAQRKVRERSRGTSARRHTDCFDDPQLPGCM